VLNVTCHPGADELQKIPRKGSLIVVANHPFGGLDGLVVSSLLREVRGDVKVLANSRLARILQLHGTMLFVDPFGGPGAARLNLGSLRQAIAHVKAGGALVIFPAGEVSHWNLRHRAVIDPPRSQTVARLVRITGAPVLPVYFHGRNSALFNLWGRVHPRLRTALLPRELLRRRNSRVVVEIGTPIPFARLKGLESDAEMTRYLRLRTYILQTRRADAAARPPEERSGPRAPMEAIAEEGDPGPVMDEIAALPREARLLESGERAVYLARAAQIPQTLLEIGRLREVTFRATHEGTGRARDLDAFDEAYLHLICWHRERGQIVGAHCLGATDESLPRRGVAGLYTRTVLLRQYMKLSARLLGFNIDPDSAMSPMG
jgi:putative hemolysin